MTENFKRGRQLTVEESEHLSTVESLRKTWEVVWENKSSSKQVFKTPAGYYFLSVSSDGSIERLSLLEDVHFTIQA